MSRRTISILGSTGSIGTQTLDVVRRHAERFRVVGLSARNNVAQLAAQVFEFRPRMVAVGDARAAEELAALCAGCRAEIVVGPAGYEQVATLAEACTVVVAMVGSGGLRPCFAAIRAGKDVALANKEALVMAGDAMMKAAAEHGVSILPIDSEHSAIWQCLRGGNGREVRRIVLTASGGPFRGWSRARMARVTVQEALNHPTWAMGGKITIDSATLMNKGLEVIEAHHLFGLPPERIEVVIHPQSIIHSLVEFVDGSVIAQLGLPDMRVPIQYALSYPERLPRDEPPLDLVRLGSLTFEAPDLERFPCLRLACEALARGGTAPAALSVANEVAVQAFLQGGLGFGEIAGVIAGAVASHRYIAAPTLEQVLETESETRRLAEERVQAAVW